MKPSEQSADIETLRGNSEDTTRELVVLRQAIRRLYEQPFGFWLVWGPPGNAKSEALRIIVAESCRRGRVGKYYTAAEVDARTKQFGENEDVEGSPAAFEAMLGRVDVLAIDEMDKLAWTQWQIQHIGAVIDERYRDMANKLTVFAANTPPQEWGRQDEMAHLTSRFYDGRHRMIWHGERVPPCLSGYVTDEGKHYIPGVFHLTVADVRPSLPAKE